MTAYIILIVIVAVVLLGVGGTVLLRPRGMHGVRRGRARELDLTGSMPKLDDTSAGTGTATATAPPPQRQAPRARPRPRAPPWRSRRPRRAA